MRVTTSTTIAAPADAVWQHVGPGFAAIADWASEVVHSAAHTEAAVADDDADKHPDGAPDARRCRPRMPGVGPVVERLTGADHERRTLSYRLTEGGSALVRQARNTLTVEADGQGRSRFTMDAEIVPAPFLRPVAPVLRAWLGRLGRLTGDDLRHLAETGRPSPRKLAVASGAVGRLARALTANALFSGVCGLALAAAAGPVAEQLGNPPVELVRGTGLVLVDYAAVLAALAALGPSARSGRLVAALDGAWVLASAVALAVAGSALTADGVVGVVLVAAVVEGFAVWQWRAAGTVDRAGSSPQPPSGRPEKVSAGGLW